MDNITRAVAMLSVLGRPEGRSALVLIGNHCRRVFACGGLLLSFVGTDVALAQNPLHSQSDSGLYLAQLGNCESCHTDPSGGSPFAGGRPIHTPFGAVYSTNITPDNESGIGRWTFDDFKQAMRHGRRPNGDYLYPAFPYTAFAQLSDADLRALFDFLKLREPVSTEPHENTLAFPYNQRWLMSFWQMLYHDPKASTLDASQDEAWNRGAYLVNALAHCGACHAPRDRLGGTETDAAMTGGRLLDRVKLGWVRSWSATNLTGHARGLASWEAQDLAEYLQTGQSDIAVAHGPMVEVIQNGTRYLTDADLNAVVHYLKSLPAAEASDASPDASAAVLRDGEIAYTVHCATCHLSDGMGDRTMGVPLRTSPIVRATHPESLINVILYGPELPAPPFSTSRSGMGMHGKRLSNNDIAAIASYIRTEFGDNAGAVTPIMVQKQR